MKNIKNIFKTSIERTCHVILDTIKIIKYSKYPKYYEHNIKVGDIKFRMSFGNYPLTQPIIERIEGKRDIVQETVIKSIISKGFKVLELGGCYGYFTMLMSYCAGKNGKVVTIEGTPNNFKILQNNIKLNKATNITAYNVFLSTNSDFVDFNQSDIDPYSAIAKLISTDKAQLNTIKTNKNKLDQSETIKVKAIKLTNFLNFINFSPDIIFMDIEGFETEVIEDLSKNYFTKTLNNRPIVFFEHHLLYYKGGRDLNFIKTHLEQHNYLIREIQGNWLCTPE